MCISYFLFQINFNGTQSICHPCWQRFDRAISARNILPAEEEQPVLEDPPAEPLVEVEGVDVDQQLDLGSIAIPGYLRTSNTGRRCLFQSCRNVATNVVPLHVKFSLLHNNNFYIPSRARVCLSHLGNNYWEELLNDETTTHVNFNGAHVLDIINIYKWGVERRSQIDFENIEEIDDNELHFWTSLSKSQFNRILELTPSLRNRSNCPATVLGCYLVKIRTGDSDDRLATKLNISRRTFERKLRIARECLLQDFVPSYLGVNHITREDAIARNLTIPRYIFGNQNETGIFIFDGTYIYVQKSANFLFQRITYSLHKFRNLVKPFLIICSDGYIVDVLGPYPATTSDATIMRHIMQDEESAWHWFFRPGDAFILDRGFRDALPAIEECGYVPHMPPTRERREQLTTMDANKSRLVTMCRWVIETINGRFKKDFKLFRNTYFNRSMQNMMPDFKITAAIINLTKRPYEDSRYCQEFMDIIDRNISRENALIQYVNQNNLNRQRVAFAPLESDSPDLEDFPRLSFEDLILFTLGTYHLRIAKSYCHEHMRPNGVYIIEIYRHRQLINNKVLIRGRIQSRHVRARQYYTYILFDPTEEGRESLIDYYCSCVHGRRTVGSCAHIASIIYFLSWARHEEVIDTPAAFLDDITVDLDNAE